MSRLAAFAPSASRLSLYATAAAVLLAGFGLLTAHAQTAVPTSVHTITCPGQYPNCFDGELSGGASDSSGNLYFGLNNPPGDVYKLTRTSSGSFTTSVPFSNLAAPYGVVDGVAVDAQGDVYIGTDSGTNTTYPLLKETYSGGAYTQSTVESTQLAGSLGYSPTGALFVGNNNDYLGYIPSGSTTLTPLSSTSTFAEAFDAAGDVYVSTATTNGIYVYTRSGSTYSGPTQLSFTGGSLVYPLGLSRDAYGNLFIGENNNSATHGPVNTMYWAAPTATTNTYALTAVVTTCDAAGTTVVDPYGNAFCVGFPPTYNGKSYITEFEVDGLNQTGTAFASTAVGSSSMQAIIFKITGSGTFGTPVVLTKGTTGLDFTDGTSYTTGVNTCKGALAIGALCTVTVQFSPLAPGQRMGAVELVDGNGNVVATAYISGIGTAPLATFTPGTLSTFAGSGTACSPSTATCGDGGAATASGAKLQYPAGMAMDGAGNLYFADLEDNRVRKVSAGTGILSTVAGTGTACSTPTATCGDGGAATGLGANLNEPGGVAVDGAGNLYIADVDDNRIRKVTPTGILSTVAGTGAACPAYTATCGDGGAATASGAELYQPGGVAVDGAGNLYIADTSDNRIRMVSASTGILSTVAGTGPFCSPSTAACGDGGAATASGADLNDPTGVAVDAAGNLYIADSSDNRIREVTAATGNLSTVAGSGSQCSPSTATCGDGSAATATVADLYYPRGVAVDAGGNLYIADQSDNRIRKVTAATGILSTVAGTGTQCSSTTATCGDGGAATAGGADFFRPGAVLMDSAGNLYIGDNLDNRIRKVSATTPPLIFPDTAINATSASQTFTVNNIGNTALTLPVPSTGQDPSLSSNFTLSNSSTCPLVYSSSSSAGTLAAGATCTEILSYSPTVSGSVTGALTFTDNSLNAAGSTQTVIFTGSSTSTLSVAAISQNITAGTASITLEFTVGYGGNTAPTATPTLTVNGSATGVGAITCSGKLGHNTCMATYNTSTLAPGTYTITATQPADSNYSATSGTATLTVTAVSPMLKPILKAPVKPVLMR